MDDKQKGIITTVGIACLLLYVMGYIIWSFVG